MEEKPEDKAEEKDLSNEELEEVSGGTNVVFWEPFRPGVEDVEKVIKELPEGP